MKLPFNIENNTLKGFLIHIVLAVVILTGTVLFFFNSYLPAFTNHGESITVPDLEGIHMDKLEDFLVKRSLRYEVNDSSYTEKYPPLTILKQYPKPGSRVKENRKIFVSVNRINPPSVPVPELVERSLRNAEAVLASNELKRGEIIFKPSQFLNLVLEMRANGKILQAGDRIDKGSTIDLVVGNGCSNCNFEAPDLVGNEFEIAKLIIIGSNLEIGLISIEGDTTDQENVIIKQEPESGQTVRNGSIINLWIGPKPEEEVVDDADSEI